jgi:TPR repeat protein
VVPASVSPSVLTLLVTRGDAMLATGDVSGARLMYQRAAKANSAQAAMGMGKTYDPKFLTRISAQGIAADPKQARVWYQRAADMGNPEATRLLAELPRK